jgi:hypothetical protein
MDIKNGHLIMDHASLFYKLRTAIYRLDQLFINWKLFCS